MMFRSGRLNRQILFSRTKFPLSNRLTTSIAPNSLRSSGKIYGSRSAWSRQHLEAYLAEKSQRTTTITGEAAAVSSATAGTMQTSSSSATRTAAVLPHAGAFHLPSALAGSSTSSSRVMKIIPPAGKMTTVLTSLFNFKLLAEHVRGIGRPLMWLVMTVSWTCGTFYYMLLFEEWGREEQYKAVPKDIKSQKQRLCTQLQSSCLAMQATGQEVVTWCKQCLAAWTS
ncbi:unnamed protein product [Amoebophrya sp. A120]|nr:unnamed protein product [Amoebophrya sp. A120]|eukprot:GSA120T00010619001.1